MEIYFKLFAGLIVLFYLGAFLLSFKQRGLLLFGIGFGLNLFFIGMKWVLADAPPLGTIYHVLAGVPLAFFPVALGLRRRMPAFPAMSAVLALSAAIPLIGTLFMTPPVVWKRVPILQSDWFIPHVLAYCIAYGLCLAAFILLGVTLIRLARGKEAFRYELGSRLLILLAFPLLTFGLCSGALWGDQAWGSYWGWDPKENWGLITWFLYALYLHCAALPQFRKEALLVQFLAFAALGATCFMVAYTRLGTASKHFYGS